MFLKYLHGLDSYERHQIVADSLKKSVCDSRTVLDVGGETKLTTNRLSYFLPGRKVVTANIIPQTSLKVDDVLIPLPDDSFDAVVSIDTIEHIPRQKRKQAVSEYFRVAKKEVVITGPIDNEYQRESEKRLNEKYKKLFGKDHHFLIEHIRYGDPKTEELIDLLGDKKYSLLYVSGTNNTIHAKHIERAFSFCPKIKMINKLFKLFYTIYSIKDYKPLKYIDTPTPFTRRFLTHIIL